MASVASALLYLRSKNGAGAMKRTTKAAAHAATEAAAFTIADCYEGAGRRIIHVVMGALGADWDVAGVHDLIDEADDVAWSPGMFRHNLAVLVGGKLYRLDVHEPRCDESGNNITPKATPDPADVPWGRIAQEDAQ